MPKAFLRFITLLCVPCLLSTTVDAHTFVYAQPKALNSSFTPTFESEAILPVLVEGFRDVWNRFLSSRQAQDAAHLQDNGVFVRTGSYDDREFHQMLLAMAQTGNSDIPDQLDPNKHSSSSHQYRRLTEEEYEIVLQDVSAELARNWSTYVAGFKSGLVSSLEEARVVFPEDVPVPGDFRLGLKKDNLVRDENGKVWVIKQYHYDPKTGRYKNHLKREVFAFLLTQRRANYVEIRILRPEEAREIDPAFSNSKDLYLSRVVSGSNISAQSLAHLDPGQAFSALFVAHMLLRKWDPHLSNVGFAENVPVAVDHDEVGRHDRFNSLPSSFEKFAGLFVYHFLFRFVNWGFERGLKIEPSHGNPLLLGGLQVLNDTVLRSMSNPQWDIVLGMMEATMNAFGLGRAQQATEGWSEEYLRQSIIEFKSIPEAEVRTAAQEAGYHGTELESLVAFIRGNQKTLGKDVALMLAFLTGDDYNLQAIDTRLHPSSLGIIASVESLDVLAKWPVFINSEIEILRNRLSDIVRQLLQSLDMTEVLLDFDTLPLEKRYAEILVGFIQEVLKHHPVTDDRMNEKILELNDLVGGFWQILGQSYPQRLQTADPWDNAYLTAIRNALASFGLSLSEPLKDAFTKVDRARFVPKEASHYLNQALPIGYGQTTTQPSLVAWMILQALSPAHAEADKPLKFLTVGTGTGFGDAVLAEYLQRIRPDQADRIDSVERVPELARQATDLLGETYEGRITVHEAALDAVGNPQLGWSENGPYDAILVYAQTQNPESRAILARQLKVGGRLILPWSSEWTPTGLVVYEREPNNNTHIVLAEVARLSGVGFVPLVDSANIEVVPHNPKNQIST